MKRLKEKIALLCVLTLLFSCIGPISHVSAAEAWQTGFSGTVTTKDGIVTLGSNTRYRKSPADLPASFVAVATMRVVKFPSSGTFSLAISNLNKRTGLYISEAKVRPFSDSPADAPFDVGTGWHDYRFHVDGSSHKIYIDNKLVVSGLTNSNGRNEIEFTTPANGILEIDELKFQYEKEASAVVSEETKEADPRTIWIDTPQTEEYTPEFTVDWADPETYKDWAITPTKDITMDKETGILTLDSTATDGSRLAGGPHYTHQIERILKAPENWDVEMDVQIVRSENGSFQIKAIADNQQTYYFVREDRAVHTHDGEQKTGGQMILGKDWHHWKFEVRGDKQTLFIDGRALHECTPIKHSSNLASIRFCLDVSYGDYLVNIGKVHYKPYFPEVNLITPLNSSSYAEGSDIIFTSKPETKADYVDYYVDSVKIGRGYAPDYKYVFKTAKVGTFEVSAGVGGKMSEVKHKVTVQNGFNAALKLNKTEIKLGETVNASIEYDYYNKIAKPNRVDYYVDGNKVGTSTTAPFKMTLKDMKIGTSLVEARVYNGNGAASSDMARVIVYDTKASSGKLAREYEIDYNYGSGNGVINITDSSYKLNMKHSAEGITYESYTGTETYALGAGKYKVAVISGIAEVYYNGQYAFSFFMPKASENKITYSGISNFKISGNGTKVRYLSKKWDNKNLDVNAINMPNYFNLEFDKTDASDETIVVYDGEHKIPLEFKDGKINAYNFKTETSKAHPIVLNGEAKAGYYKLVCNKGLCQLYLDNQYVDSFKAIPQPGMAKVQRTMSNPSASTTLEIKGIDDIYYHADDFNGNTECESLDYWLPDVDGITASMTSTGNNGHMKVEGTGTYLLAASTYNTDTTWKAKVTSGDEYYIATRFYSGRHHLKVGYDYLTQTWFTDEFFDMAEYDHSPEYDTYVNRMEFDGPELTMDEWHDFELHTNRGKVVFKMDGEVIIDTDQIQSDYSGHIGMGVTNGSVLIDDFSYEGECGAYGSLITRIVNGRDALKLSDLVRLADGTVIGHYYSKWYVTRDNGKTWTLENSTNTKLSAYSHTLKNGTHITAAQVGGQYYCFASTDDCVTWEQRGLITNGDFDNVCILNGSWDETSDGTIYIPIDSGLSEMYSQPRIMYSKDEGWTWQESEVMYGNIKTGEHDSTHTHFTNVHIEEMTPEELPDGKTHRMFARSSNGFVYYMDSTDGGKTWGEIRPTELIHPLVTYNIEQDPDDPNVYYALTVHAANTETYYDIDLSRSRLAFFVSHDGMKTWEYVATISESAVWNVNTRCNMVTKVYGDTIYITDTENLDNKSSMIYTFDKTKLKSKKRLESIHPPRRQHFQMSTGFLQYADRLNEMSFLPATSGDATIFGNNVSVTVKDGMYDAETIGRVFGAQVVKSGSTVTFKIGEGSVKFTEGSKNYIVNGETKNFTSVCLKNGYFNIEACAEAFERQLDKIDGINVIDLSNK